MANYYTDHPEIEFHLNHPLMRRVAELKERGYSEKEKYEEAPVDYEDCIENYRRILGIAGDIAANTIAPNSEDVDLEGPHLENGRMKYASKTVENMEAVRLAGLWGVTMPRRYGGLNAPETVFSMASEVISAADSSFQNIWSLQSCAETLYEFGSEEQRQKFIPRICAGETMSMDLTEPDAGSVLQSVMLKATWSEEQGCWLLNGVKRFITNGDSDIHLVLARSEEGTRDGRGLSMFIYDKRQGGVNVRHIEHKLGIHGSPTCELTYKDARAELCGERRLGLIKYVMALMNGARLGIGAQSVGLSQEAYNEAVAYASERAQFGQKINRFPGVYDMLSRMKAKLDASRSLQNAYDAISVHGGSGFIMEYKSQRLYRDARIFSIYEGTTQLQVVAAIRYITNGTYLGIMNEMLQENVLPELEPLKARVAKLVGIFSECVAKVREAGDSELQDFLARRLYDMTGEIVMSLLLLRDATAAPEMFLKSAKVYCQMACETVAGKSSYILDFDRESLPAFRVAED